VKETEDKAHFGFAPNKIVGLKYFGIVKVEKIVSENGKIIEVQC